MRSRLRCRHVRAWRASGRRACCSGSIRRGAGTWCAAIAKLYATEAAVTATRDATQIFGGYGFIDDTLVARHYRDAKILEIGEGTSEIQRLVISRTLGLPIA